MYGADIEITDEDFELATPPLSKKFLCLTFEKYELRFIIHFGENMFYIGRQDSEPMNPVYVESRYPEDIELILDFMTRERIRVLSYTDGVLCELLPPVSLRLSC